MKKKNRIHIIHHTHWDMEWYFTTHDTNALLNYTLNHAIKNLDGQKDSFLFDGQTSPFEELPKNKEFFNRFKKSVKANNLKVGPWYSQAALRITSDEGIYRNFHYGQYIGDMKTNSYDYLYTPDTFGFGENTPTLYNAIGKKFSVLWRGVDRDALRDAPIFKWVSENGNETFVYNIASGYFVGRYLYSDKSLESLYKNNIIPSIKRQTENGKYTVAAIPSGGDQQPYNIDIKNAIKKLNAKNDGNEYILSTWNEFFKELEPQLTDVVEYKGSHVRAYGGRLHKLVGAHRPDIKKLIYQNEMKISRVLEPMLLMSPISIDMYPEMEMDKMWKNVLLSQAHDAYTACNSDQVNKNIVNRLEDSENIYNSNKDLLMRYISQEYSNGSLVLFNPTQYSGEKAYDLIIATNKKSFEILDGKKNLDYVVKSQEKIPGGVRVVYTADGEIENKRPDVFVTYIKLQTTVKKASVKELKVNELDKQVKNPIQTSFNVKYAGGLFNITKGSNKTKMNINFTLDGGDGYDLDIYEEIQPLTLKNARVKKIFDQKSGSLAVAKYSIEIEIPKGIDGWLKNKNEHTLIGEVTFTVSNKLEVSYKFNNLQENLLIQPTFEQKHSSDSHTVLTHNGYITRNNTMFVDEKEYPKLREMPSDFDLMHGNVLVGDKNPMSISSLDLREYMIDKNGISFNMLRTPDVLGRANLRIRPGRASGLPDKVVYTPESTTAVNDLSLSLVIDFNLSETELAHIVDYHVIGDLGIHRQELYRYYSNVNTWTLPSVKTKKQFLKTINISNNKIVVQALFKSRGDYYLRLNNPFSKELKTNIKFFDKEHKEVTIKSHESKTYKIRAN